MERARKEKTNYREIFRHSGIGVFLWYSTKDAVDACGELRSSIYALEGVFGLEGHDSVPVQVLRRECSAAIKKAEVELSKLRNHGGDVAQELARYRRNMGRLRGGRPPVNTREAREGMARAYHSQKQIYEKALEHKKWVDGMIKTLTKLIGKARRL